MGVSEGSDAVTDLKKIRVEGEAARHKILENIDIQDEKDLMERTSVLLARMS